MQASYVLGGGALLAQVRGSGAGATASYVLPDGQGSVRALANSAGTITATYRYDAYGTQTSSSGTTTNPYRYDGQRCDDGTGLYQLRARSYDPGTGRFLSRDTADVEVSDPAQLNRYGYVRDDPVDAFDPSGHDALYEYGGILEGEPAIGTSAVAVGKALALTYIRAVLYAGLDAEDAAVVFDWVVRAVDILQDFADAVPIARFLAQLLASLVHAAHGAGGSGGSGGSGMQPGDGGSGSSGGGASGSGAAGGSNSGGTSRCSISPLVEAAAESNAIDQDDHAYTAGTLVIEGTVNGQPWDYVKRGLTGDNSALGHAEPQAVGWATVQLRLLRAAGSTGSVLVSIITGKFPCPNCRKSFPSWAAQLRATAGNRITIPNVQDLYWPPAGKGLTPQCWVY